MTTTTPRANRGCSLFRILLDADRCWVVDAILGISTNPSPSVELELGVEGVRVVKIVEVDLVCSADDPTVKTLRSNQPSDAHRPTLDGLRFVRDSG